MLSLSFRVNAKHPVGAKLADAFELVFSLLNLLGWHAPAAVQRQKDQNRERLLEKMFHDFHRRT
jgi:hypothetical protein